jgi:hypothetical protein
MPLLAVVFARAMREAESLYPVRIKARAVLCPLFTTLQKIPLLAVAITNLGLWMFKCLATRLALGATLAIAAALVPVAAPAVTISTLFNTGVNDSGVALPDNTPEQHFILTSVPGGTSSIITEASPGFQYIPPWIGNSATSAWIRPDNPGTIDPAGSYTFQLTFDLSGYVLSTVNIAGRWATDNSGTNILVNGTPTGQTATGYESWTNFTIAQNLLTAGSNTIAFVVLNLNDGNFPTGLRVEFTTATASQVPLPAPLLLFATGLGVFGLYSRRKQRKAELA